MVKMSIVTPTFERDSLYLDNLLLTLQHQTAPPWEVVVVDMNVERAWGIPETCDKYPFAKRVLAMWDGEPDMLNVAWGINVGIKATHPESALVLVTGVEMMFSRGYIETLMNRMRPDLYALAPCGFLPPCAPLDNVLEGWSELVNMAAGDQEDFTVPVKPWMDGTIKVMTRDWWHKYRGYDEALVFKPKSDNVNRRASSSGLDRLIIPFSEGQVLHQWHEPAWGLIKNTEADWEYFLERCKMLVTNPNGWGELDGPRLS